SSRHETMPLMRGGLAIAVIFGQGESVRGTSPTAPTARWCPQCRREVPGGARNCPYCSAVIGAGVNGGFVSTPASIERVAGGEERGSGWLMTPKTLGLLAVAAIVIMIGAFMVVTGAGTHDSGMPWPIWIVAGLVLLAIEVHYTGDFTLFCFGVSALTIGLMTAVGIFGMWLQWMGFAA